jgi:hypothetical protein
MLDIETLDTTPTAVILSIGAVRFDIDKPQFLGEKFHHHIDIASNQAYHRTISGSTVEWWMKQNDEARQKITSAIKSPLPDVLGKLLDFIGDAERIWGNGSDFDNVIVLNACKATGVRTWKYSANSCYRTLKNLYPEIEKPNFEGVAHDALDDAINQALHLQSIYQHMRNVE